MFKSCPSLCRECTPRLAGPGPPVHVCKGSLNSVCKPSLALSPAQLHCGRCLTPAANREPGCQLRTNSKPGNYHLSSAWEPWGSLDLGEGFSSANGRAALSRQNNAQPWHPRHRPGHWPARAVLLLDANIAKLTLVCAKIPSRNILWVGHTLNRAEPCSHSQSLM